MIKLFLVLYSLLIAYEVSSKDYALLVKQCFSCGWQEYHEFFHSREMCEIARQGVFVNGITLCKRKPKDYL